MITDVCPSPLPHFPLPPTSLLNVEYRKAFAHLRGPLRIANLRANELSLSDLTYLITHLLAAVILL
jgi:hypothetical protein